MKSYPYIVRVLIPSAVLILLQFYRSFLSPNYTIPLGLQLGVAFLCGFLGPKGSWKWAVLIGLGVPLGDWIGHFVDSSLPSPIHSLGAPIVMARSFIPTLGVVYMGVFLHQRIWGTFSEDEPSEPTFKDKEASLERFFSQYQSTKEGKGEEEAKQVARAYLLLHGDPSHQPEKVSPIPHPYPQETSSPLPQENHPPEVNNAPPIEREEQKNEVKTPPLSEDPHHKLSELEKKLGLGHKRAIE